MYTTPEPEASGDCDFEGSTCPEDKCCRQDRCNYENNAKICCEKTSEGGLSDSECSRCDKCVDCKWSMWSSWSQCSLSRGSCIKTSERRTTQNAGPGGIKCSGDRTKSEKCNPGSCAPDIIPPPISDCSSTLRVRSTGQAMIKQKLLMGSYLKQEKLLNDRPMFTHEHKMGIVYWENEEWRVYAGEKLPNVRENIPSILMLTNCNRNCPEECANVRWKYYDGDTELWKLDSKITITVMY